MLRRPREPSPRIDGTVRVAWRGQNPLECWMSGALRRVMTVWLAVLLAAGCVNTYDPEGHGRLTLDTRAEETGRPVSPDAGLRVVGRRKAASPKPPPVDRFAEQRTS